VTGALPIGITKITAVAESTVVTRCCRRSSRQLLLRTTGVAIQTAVVLSRLPLAKARAERGALSRLDRATVATRAHAAASTSATRHSSRASSIYRSAGACCIHARGAACQTCIASARRHRFRGLRWIRRCALRVDGVLHLLSRRRISADFGQRARAQQNRVHRRTSQLRHGTGRLVTRVPALRQYESSIRQ
jgi:hypothetical protein